MMIPMDCPKFSDCGAPICPLHERWRNSVHVRGERVCLWLRELQKDGGAQRLSAALRTDMVLAICACHQEIFSGSATLPLGVGDLKRELVRAATTGSKLRAGERLQEAANA